MKRQDLFYFIPLSLFLSLGVLWFYIQPNSTDIVQQLRIDNLNKLSDSLEIVSPIQYMVSDKKILDITQCTSFDKDSSKFLNKLNNLTDIGFLYAKFSIKNKTTSDLKDINLILGDVRISKIPCYTFEKNNVYQVSENTCDTAKKGILAMGNSFFIKKEAYKYGNREKTKVSVASNTTKIIYIEIEHQVSGIKRFQPVLYGSSRDVAFLITKNTYDYLMEFLWNHAFVSIMSFQIAYSIVQLFLVWKKSRKEKNRELKIYGNYIFYIIFSLVFFICAYGHVMMPMINSKYLLWIIPFGILLAYWFYFLFIRQFLGIDVESNWNMPNNYFKWLKKIFPIITHLILAVAIINLILSTLFLFGLLPVGFVYARTIQIAVTTIVILAGFGLFLLIYRYSRHPSKNLISIGIIGLLMGSTVTRMATIALFMGKELNFEYLAFIELGILFEVGFFNSALAKQRVVNEKKIKAERRIFASFLHNDIKNTINTIKGYLSLLLEVKDDLMKFSAIYTKLIEICNKTHNNVTMYESIISGEELTLKLKEIIDTFVIQQGVFNIDMRIDDSTIKALNSSEQYYIYLLIKETVNNAIKHGGCNDIIVEFNRKSELFYELLITDNGKGFNVENIIEGGGFRSYRGLSELIDAKFDIESSNKGTKVSFLIPTLNIKGRY